MKEQLTKEELKEVKQVLRLLVKEKDAIQKLRVGASNRNGLKKNGEVQKNPKRAIVGEGGIRANTLKTMEQNIEKEIILLIKKFPVWNEFLKDVKGIGPQIAAYIIAEFDIEIATTVSKMWQFAGLNPGLVRGKKRKENKESYEIITTDKFVRGDQKHSGYISPFNSGLRVKLMGVLADSFIKSKSPYALNFYYPYKERLANSNQMTTERKKGGEEKVLAWKDCTLGHRDNAARRKMIKEFLKDTYANWRRLEGLEVRCPYEEEYLGRKHHMAG